jgi:hypothetical protein
VLPVTVDADCSRAFVVLPEDLSVAAFLFHAAKCSIVAQRTMGLAVPIVLAAWFWACNTLVVIRSNATESVNFKAVCLKVTLMLITKGAIL